MARCPHCEADIAMLGIDEEASRASMVTVHICPSCEAVLGVSPGGDPGELDSGVDP